jgi:hypothetical protein
MKIYKIRSKETGMFSTGSMNPSWAKRGKEWRQVNHLRSHLSQYYDFWEKHIPYDRDFTQGEVAEALARYDNAEIVVYELKEVTTEDISHDPRRPQGRTPV